MSFVVYDLVLLGLFVLGVVLFLSTRKKNLKRQGILYLYKTKLGINFIDKFAKRFEKVLKPMQYVVIASGYILMVGIIWLFIKTTYIYLTTQIVQLIRAPPIAPLIPYFPRIFGLESFFPPLYFTYFIIALGIVAVSHEFAHGIFARLHNFKIHSTGFAFLGPILGAFVEPDEKKMQKADKFSQLSVLAAGTFANVLMTIIFGLILWLFFSGLFVPAGVKFNSYAISQVDVKGISVIGNSSIDEKYIEIEVETSSEIDDPNMAQLAPDESSKKQRFFVEPDRLQKVIENSGSSLIVYDDLPAIRSQIERGSAITEIGGRKINSIESLRDSIQLYRPGDKINVKTAILDPGRGTVQEVKEYELELGEKNGITSLGIGLIPPSDKGVLGFIYTKIFSKIKDPFLHYESSIGDFGWFVYYLLWWVIVINFFVALFNMLPLGILDGGRFFYLTMWGISGSENFGRKSYKFITWFLLALLLVLMLRWAGAFFG